MRSCMIWAGEPGENLVVAQAGRRLRAAARAGAVVARWASDQFAVLVDDLGAAGVADAGVISTGPVAELAERLTEAIGDEPFSVADKETLADRLCRYRDLRLRRR